MIMLFPLFAEVASKAAATEGKSSLFHVKWENWTLIIEISGLVLVFVVLAAGAFSCLWWRRARGVGAEIDEVTLKFGDVFSQKIKVNRDTQRVAFAAYTELITRKVALPFDEQHDVISEVYDSWYQVFGVIRELIKQVPAHHLARSEPTQQLADVLIKLLNEGLRPHLTRWQARYRRWYRHAESMDQSKGIPPQEIQKQFSDYSLLVKDLREVNQRVLEFARELKVLALGRRDFRRD